MANSLPSDGSTPEIKAMKRNNIPLTLENWLDFIYPNGVPNDWQQELDVPEELQDEASKKLPKKGSFTSAGGIELISYATEWDVYLGHVEWDDLDVEKQDLIISTYMWGKPNDRGLVMNLGLLRKEYDGLHHLLLGVSLSLERMGLGAYDENWGDLQFTLVCAFFKGTIFHSRLLQIKRSDDSGLSPIYGAELMRFSSHQAYDDLCDADQTGPVAELCRSFNRILCAKGE
jgi:hypothetical protein